MSRLTVRGTTSQRDINRLLELSNDNQFGRNEAYYKLQHYEDLEEQGRLIELPCLPNEEVWESHKRFGTHKTMYASREAIVGAIEAGYAIGYTQEEAEAKLKEMEGAK